MLGSSKLTNSRSRKIKEPQGKKARPGTRKDIKFEVKEEVQSASETLEHADEARANKPCELITACF